MVESKARWKRLIAFMLAFAMVFSSIAVSSFSTVTVQAASRNVKKAALRVNAKDVTRKTINVYSGDKKTLKVFATPNSAKKKVTFKSSKPSVASVTKKGVITAKKKGTAKINVTVTGKDNKKTRTYVNVKVKYVKLSLNRKNASVNPGKSITLKAASTPKKTVKWSSSDKAVATVSSKGVVKGVKAGTATITARVGQKKAACKVTVKEGGIPVTAVEASLGVEELSVGNIAQITASVVPANATDKTLSYSSDNEAVATVTEAGAVLGISEGTANITVRSSNGKTTVIPVTVKYVSLTGIAVTPDKLDLDIDGVYNLTAAFTPENASVKTVTWSSNNAAVADVDENGKVTGHVNGTAIITATAADGSGISGQCEVTVKRTEDLTVELVNPYKEAEIETMSSNTILYGDDMHIAVAVKDGGQPVAGEKISLRLRRDFANSPLGNLAPVCYEVKQQQQYATTDSNGNVDFIVGLRSGIDDNVTTGTAEVYTITASRINDNANATHKELVVNTATIDLRGIRVVSANTLTGGDNAQGAGWNGNALAQASNAISDTRVARQEQEYVVNQKVSPGSDTNNQVELTASPQLLYGREIKEKPADWEWPTSATPSGDGKSDKYMTYNRSTNETTTTEIHGIPAGVRYLTVNFEKIKLSAFTEIQVELRREDNGQLVLNGRKSLKEGNNLNTTVVGSQMGLQFESLNQDIGHYLVISVITEGRVSPSEEGYVLSRIRGVFSEAAEARIIHHDLKDGNLVTWEDVSDTLQYETSVRTAGQMAALINNAGLPGNGSTYECRIPTFPYVGDAFITVKAADGSVMGIYAYPARNNGNNRNDIAAPVVSAVDGNGNPIAYRQVILATNDEATRRCSTKDSASGAVRTDKGNNIVVNAARTGVTALKATININALSDDMFDARNGKELYTSIQWAPYAQEQANAGNNDFYAVEGQTVRVRAQLLDVNGNPKAAIGQQIEFRCGINNIADAVLQGNSGSVIAQNITLYLTFFRQQLLMQTAE